MMEGKKERVRIVEVGPRDGLQNEGRVVSLSARVRFIEKLAAAGLQEIEIGSFVRPELVPQLADTEEIAKRLSPQPGTVYTALVPNLRGLERAMAGGLKSVAVFTAASETFSRRNTNASIEESMRRFAPVIERAKRGGIRVRGYVSTAFACPFEGRIDSARAIEVGLRLIDLGVDEVSLGDTIGVATPGDVERLLEAAAGRFDSARIALHFHDTYGMAVANVRTAHQAGISVFDSSAGGLGGCPFAPGAAGNVATEDLLFLFHGLGVETGVDLDLVVEASHAIEEEIDHPLPSRAYRALRAKPPAGPVDAGGSCGP